MNPRTILVLFGVLVVFMVVFLLVGSFVFLDNTVTYIDGDRVSDTNGIEPATLFTGADEYEVLGGDIMVIDVRIINDYEPASDRDFFAVMYQEETLGGKDIFVYETEHVFIPSGGEETVTFDYTVPNIAGTYQFSTVTYQAPPGWDGTFLFFGADSFEVKVSASVAGGTDTIGTAVGEGTNSSDEATETSTSTSTPTATTPESDVIQETTGWIDEHRVETSFITMFLIVIIGITFMEYRKKR